MAFYKVVVAAVGCKQGPGEASDWVLLSSTP